MTNGWRKVFNDWTIEYGTDEDIASGKASWRKGRLEGIHCVSLDHNGHTIGIKGKGEYWQSDDFENRMFSETQLVTRRIQRKLVADDQAILQIFNPQRDILRVVKNDQEFQESFPVTPDIYNKWLTVEFDVRRKRFCWYISETKI